MTTFIAEVTSEGDFATTRTLFEEYATAIGIDLTFQNFAAELSRLRDTYGAPHGCLLLARHDQNVIGCVGLRHFGPGVCEMKRLYVRPTARGLQVGHQLAVVSLIRSRGRLVKGGYDGTTTSGRFRMALQERHAAMGYSIMPMLQIAKISAIS